MDERAGSRAWLQGVRSTWAPFVAISTAGDGTKSGMDSGDSDEALSISGGTFTGSNSTSALASSAASFALFVASPLAVLGLDWLDWPRLVRLASIG